MRDRRGLVFFPASVDARCLFSVSIICVLAGSALVAAEFWETKPFREWSDKEALPPQYSQQGPASTIDGFLHRDGKPDIPAARGASQPARGGAILFVGFPRTDPITLADGDVEFEVKVGSLGVKKKFKLKDMVFHGRLEL